MKRSFISLLLCVISLHVFCQNPPSTNGGNLVIDGGTITNAYLDMKVGSHLKFQNGGLLVCRTNNNFYAPQGAIVNMNDGKICNSHDF